ncbi:unnamed protein product [Closterium sp. Yama58-4]|nr:unnamed protein product [Closterium sp. Yama58-4]
MDVDDPTVPFLSRDDPADVISTPSDVVSSPPDVILSLPDDEKPVGCSSQALPGDDLPSHDDASQGDIAVSPSDDHLAPALSPFQPEAFPALLPQNSAPLPPRSPPSPPPTCSHHSSCAERAEPAVPPRAGPASPSPQAFSSPQVSPSPYVPRGYLPLSPNVHVPYAPASPGISSDSFDQWRFTGSPEKTTTGVATGSPKKPATSNLPDSATGSPKRSLLGGFKNLRGNSTSCVAGGVKGSVERGGGGNLGHGIGSGGGEKWGRAKGRRRKREEKQEREEEREEREEREEGTKDRGEERREEGRENGVAAAALRGGEGGGEAGESAGWCATSSTSSVLVGGDEEECEEEECDGRAEAEGMRERDSNGRVEGESEGRGYGDEGSAEEGQWQLGGNGGMKGEKTRRVGGGLVSRGRKRRSSGSRESGRCRAEGGGTADAGLRREEGDVASQGQEGAAEAVQAGRVVGSDGAAVPSGAWVPPVSPFGLIQERLYRDPWRLLVACMLLNKTAGRQLHKVIWDLFRLIPSPEAAIAAPTAEIARTIQSLGLHNKRAAMIQRFSAEFPRGDWTDVRQLHGIGK